MSRPYAKIINRNTEAFYATWVQARQEAEQVFEQEIRYIVDQTESVTAKQMISETAEPAESGGLEGYERMRIIINADGTLSMPALRGEPAYSWLTEFLRETERAIRRYAGKRTTDVWMLLFPRYFACRLMQNTTHEEVRWRTFVVQAKQLAGAIALFAAPGNTFLPDAGGEYEIPVSEQHVIDLHVLLELCILHEQALVQRRRLLLGGVITMDMTPHPIVKLLPHVEQRLLICTRRVRKRGAGVFSRIGLHIPPVDIERADLSNDAYWHWFCVAGQDAWEDASQAPHYEHASDVRPFLLGWFDGRDILDVLNTFRTAIESRWGLSPIEIVAAVLATNIPFRDKILDHEANPQWCYLAETRAVFSMDEAWLYERLAIGLPIIVERLGGHLDPVSVEPLVSTFLERFVSQPGGHAAPAAPLDEHTRLPTPIPFLFRAGDKLLIDLSLTLMAFSSLLNFLDLRDIQLQHKGIQFEDQVRDFLIAGERGMNVVPNLERSFYEEGREVGEADVVVRIQDTAFLIECKSRRFRGTDDCVTYKQAIRRTRDLVSWAHQVQHTAAYLANHPIGRKHRVPDDIAWIVPILCSPMVETVWQDDPRLFLIKDDIPITMTPAEILAFIQSRRWQHERDAVMQYRVSHYDVVLDRGQRLADEERLDEAISAFKRASEMKPEQDAAFRELGLAFVAQNRVDDGIAAYEKALTLNPDSAITLKNLGIALFYAGRYEDAIDAYRQALSLAPGDARILVHLANAFDAAGTFDAAINAYHGALTLDPKDPDAYYNLGVALLNNGKLCKAIKAFRKAIKLRPDYEKALSNLAVALLARGKFRQAADACRQVLAIDPENEPARSNLALALQQAGRAAEALAQLGILALHHKEPDEALNLFLTAVEYDPTTPDALHQLGRMAAADGKLEDAINLYEHTLHYNPSFFEAGRDLSIALRETEKLEEARDVLEHTLPFTPNTAHARLSLSAELNNLGIAYSDDNRFDDAIALFKQALTLKSDYPFALYNLGNAYRRKDQVDDAIDVYRKAVDLQPDYAKALSNLGTMLRKNRQVAEAIEVCRHALELDPDDRVALANLALIYHGGGWFAEAEQIYPRWLAATELECGKRHLDVATVLESYADLLTAMRCDAEATTLTDRARAIRAQQGGESPPG